MYDPLYMIVKQQVGCVVMNIQLTMVSQLRPMIVIDCYYSVMHT